MKEVSVPVNVAQDGSGWSLSESNDMKVAYLWKTPEETYLGSGYTLILPLGDELEETYSKNVVTKNGVTGLKLPNVWESYIN